MLERLVTMKDFESNEKVRTLPIEVRRSLEKTLEILDDNYGENRSIDEMGGYVLVITTDEDLKQVSVKDTIDLDADIFEYVDLIPLKHSYDWIEALILLENDYGVVIYMPIPLITKNLEKYLKEKR